MRRKSRHRAAALKAALAENDPALLVIVLGDTARISKHHQRSFFGKEQPGAPVVAAQSPRAIRDVDGVGSDDRRRGDCFVGGKRHVFVVSSSSQ